MFVLENEWFANEASFDHRDLLSQPVSLGDYVQISWLANFLPGGQSADLSCSHTESDVWGWSLWGSLYRGMNYVWITRRSWRPLGLFWLDAIAGVLSLKSGLWLRCGRALLVELLL